MTLTLAGLFVLSLRGPGGNGSDLSMLMEPDGTGVWRDLISQFQDLHPNIRVRLIEGPPATNTREDMYSTSFLSGSAAYDIVYCDVVWVPKFAAAGWLLDLTSRQSPAELEDYQTRRSPRRLLSGKAVPYSRIYGCRCSLLQKRPRASTARNVRGPHSPVEGTHVARPLGLSLARQTVRGTESRFISKCCGVSEATGSILKPGRCIWTGGKLSRRSSF